MAHDVFVSYASPDKATADAVVATLEQHQIRCWIAPRDISHGKDYAQALVQAIHGSRVLVLVFSAKANASPHVMREIERAASRGIPILPLRIEDVTPSESMEYFISSTHWLDALTPPLRRHLEQLAQSVTALLEADSGETAQTAEAPRAAADGGAEGQPTGGLLAFARRWREHPILLAAGGAIAIAFFAVIGGFLVLSSGGNNDDLLSQVPGAEEPLVEEVTGHFQADLVAQVLSGDCVSGDMVIRGEGEGEFTSDFASGHLAITGEVILDAATLCQTGYSKYVFTLTDADENTVSGRVEGPFNTLSFLSNASILTGQSEPVEFARTGGYGSAMSFTITGGSGIYEGITGTGTCTGIVGGTLDPDGSAVAGLDGECTFELAVAGESLAGLEPLIIQLAASPLQVPVSPGSFDPISAVALAVLYGNTQEEELTGLSVRLPVPSGAEIVGTTLEEEQPVSAGERIWQLPDLAPGELTRFEFLVQIRAAETPAIALIVEVDGEGFEVPIASDEVVIEIVE